MKSLTEIQDEVLKAVAALQEALKELDLSTVPRVPLEALKELGLSSVPRVPMPHRTSSAIYFVCDNEVTKTLANLREALKELNFSALPRVPIDDWGCWKQLPLRTSAVYFVFDNEGEIFYIGKTANLRGRWRPSLMSTEHTCLQPALAVRGFSLAWWSLPKMVLTVVEDALIRFHSPPRNIVGVERATTPFAIDPAKADEPCG